MSSTLEGSELRRDRTDRRVPRTRTDSFPRSPVARWVLRFALSAPLVALALLLGLVPHAATSPNATLLSDVAEIDWTRGDAEWLALLYPKCRPSLRRATPSGASD